MAQWWQDLLKSLGSTTGFLVGSVKEAAIETMDEAQRRVRETVRHVVKALVVFLILATGFLFLVAGLARFVDARWNLIPGSGAMMVGAFLLLLGGFAWMVRQ